MTKRQFDDLKVEMKKILPILLSNVEIDLKLKKGQKDYVRFIILGRSRTGSNFLRGLLNSHPNIFCYGEKFRKSELMKRRNGLKPVEFLKRKIFRAYDSSLKAIGFKLFYYHSHEGYNQELWNELIEDKELRVIHITRKNMLKTIISRKKAEATDKWTNKHKTKEQKLTFKIPYEECKDEFEWTLDYEKEYREIFKKHKVFELMYEDLELDRDNTMNKVLNFLGFSNYSLIPSTYKQRKETMKQTVTNYEELKKKFKDTKWERFFEE